MLLKTNWRVFVQLLPLEKHFLFHRFHSPQLSDADFNSLPLVLILGIPKPTIKQYCMFKKSSALKSVAIPSTIRQFYIGGSTEPFPAQEYGLIFVFFIFRSLILLWKDSVQPLP